MKTIKTCWFPALMFAIAALAAGLSHAQTPTTMNTGISWAAPTQYTDNTAIAAGDISKYTVKCGTSSTALSTTIDVAGTATSVSKAQLISGMSLALATPYWCALTVTTKNGLTSANSATVNFILPDQRVPKAPTLAVQ